MLIFTVGSCFDFEKKMRLRTSEIQDNSGRLLIKTTRASLYPLVGEVLLVTLNIAPQGLASLCQSREAGTKTESKTVGRD